MGRKPPPRHVKLTARQRRRAVPRHAVEPEVPVGTVTTLAVTVAGAVAVASSAYGYVPMPRLAAAPGGAKITKEVPANAPGAPSLSDRLVALRKAGKFRDGELATAAGDATQDDFAKLLQDDLQGQPSFLSIPSIRTTSSLISLGLQENGALEVPSDPLQAGWYERGPRPGDPGPAVVAGHLDSKVGPGIFARLLEMKPGDIVHVTRVDGKVLAFAVTRVDQYPKRAFPTRQVYGPTDAAELRVITCGGSFNKSTGHYRDNIVVFARLIPSPA